jgi:hypothetical protein
MRTITLDSTFHELCGLGYAPTSSHCLTARPCPSSPPKGIETDADIPNRASLQMRDEALYPGPNSSIYSYTKSNDHWNLYRIPLQ